jgi:predicted enzyme related to lactoylglutathione lyase
MRETLLNEWISLRVKDPQRLSEWYKQYLRLELLGSIPEFRSHALGIKDNGVVLVLLPGEQLDKPDSLQIHFHVDDADVEYKRLQANGVEFPESKGHVMGMVASIHA